MSCGSCDLGDICQQGSCVPEPDPEVVCAQCGTCQRASIETDAVGACNQNCLAAALCPEANGDADFELLHRDLLRRGFAVSGDAYALEIDEVSGVPDVSLLVVPFVNASS